MSRDYFADLGLKPGRYSSQEISQRFFSLRAGILPRLHRPAEHVQAREQMEKIYSAKKALATPGMQAEHLRALRVDDRVAFLQGLIDASLEDGLLRDSRRRDILREGRELGFSDFQVHLLIAQVQVGDKTFLPKLIAPSGDQRPRSAGRPAQATARAAAVGLLSLAMFLAAMHWLVV